MEIIRHKKNIGSSPNYLRAVELSNLKYTWILCDDDPLDFSDCADVIDAIESGKYDILLIGDPQDIVWEGGVVTNTKELIDKSGRYYDILGFIWRTLGLDPAVAIHQREHIGEGLVARSVRIRIAHADVHLHAVVVVALGGSGRTPAIA